MNSFLTNHTWRWMTRVVRRCAALTAAIGIASGSGAHGQTISSPRDIPFDYESFAQAVANVHPEASADRIQSDIASLNSEVAGTLPDPTVSLGRTGMEVGKNKDQPMEMESPLPMKATTVGISQMFPWPGTLQAAEDVARAQAKAASLTYNLSQLRRYLAAKELYLEMADAQEKLRIAADNLTEAKKVWEFSEERFRQGVGTHMDVLSSRSEVALLQANLGSLETRLKNLKANAAIMLGLSPTKPPEFKLDLFAESSSPLKNESDRSATQDDLVRDTIRAQSTAAEASKRELALRTMPNFSLSATMASMETGDNSLSIMAGISVPIFSSGKRQAIDTQTDLILRETHSRLEWHESQKELAIVQLNNRRRQLESNLSVLRKEVIPAMREHFEKALVEYSQGRGALRDIVDSQQILLRQQTASLMTRKELARTELAATRIEAGMFQGEINPMIAELPLTLSGTMSRDMGQMQGTSSEMSRSGMNSLQNSPSSLPPAGQDLGGGSDSENGQPAAGMPGMGM